MWRVTVRGHRALRRLVLCGSVLLPLAACEAPPPMSAASAEGPIASPLEGEWMIAEVLPAGTVEGLDPPPLGEILAFSGPLATSPTGRVCPLAGYRREPAALGEIGFDPARLAITAHDTVRVLCDGEPLAAFTRLADGTVLTRTGPWLLRLVRGKGNGGLTPLLTAAPATTPPPAAAPTAKMAARPAKPAPAPAPAIAAPPAATKPPPPVVPPGAAPASKAHIVGVEAEVYIASYRSEEQALHAYARLAERVPQLSRRAPLTKRIDVPGQGSFVRLFAQAPADQAGEICRQLPDVPDCGARR